MMNNINFDPTIKKVIEQHEEPLESIQIPVVVDNEQYIVRQQLLKRTEIVKTFEIRKLTERANLGGFMQCDPTPSRPSTPAPPCNTINLEDITNAIRHANARERHVSFAASQPIIHISTQSQQLPRDPSTNCANIQDMMQWSETPPKEASPPFPLHCSIATSTSEISSSVLSPAQKKCVRIDQDRVLFPCVRSSGGASTQDRKAEEKSEIPQTSSPDTYENCTALGNTAREQLKRMKAKKEYFC